MALTDCPGPDVLHDCTHTAPLTREAIDEAVRLMFANQGGPFIEYVPPSRKPKTLREAHALTSLKKDRK